MYRLYWVLNFSRKNISETIGFLLYNYNHAVSRDIQSRQTKDKTSLSDANKNPFEIMLYTVPSPSLNKNTILTTSSFKHVQMFPKQINNYITPLSENINTHVFPILQCSIF